MYDTQLMAREVHELTVSYVVDNWEEFSIMSYGSKGNNYCTSALLSDCKHIAKQEYYVSW